MPAILVTRLTGKYYMLPGILVTRLTGKYYMLPAILETRLTGKYEGISRSCLQAGLPREAPEYHPPSNSFNLKSSELQNKEKIIFFLPPPFFQQSVYVLIFCNQNCKCF